MNLPPLDNFLLLLISGRARVLAETEAALNRAVLLGDPVDDLRAKYRRNQELPRVDAPAADAAVESAVAYLAPQWPADYPPLPAWFTDPIKAAELDPPGRPVVVTMSESIERKRRREDDAALEYGPRAMTDEDFKCGEDC